MPIIKLQRRLMELGRVRLGEKGPKGEPRKLNTFRFTSASESLLQEIAAKYGGTVRPWEGAPDEGYFEIVTTSSEIEIILPPGYSELDGSPGVRYSQWYEHWSGGGCQRRCDGVTEGFSNGACLCNQAVTERGEEARTCKITTRVSFMLPGSRVGTWRLDTHGYYAAIESAAMLDFLSNNADEKFVPAVLRIEHRTRKVGGQTRKFIVPVIDFPHVQVPELDAVGAVSLAINAPPPATPRPELPAPEKLPAEATFAEDQGAGWGEQPPIEQQPDLAAHMTKRMLDAAEARGDLEEIKAAVKANKQRYASDPDKHLAWLDRQLKRLEATVNA